MILDELKKAKRYAGIHAGVDKALEAMKQYTADNYPLGKVEIDGDNVFLLLNSYETRAKEEAKAEAHRKYIDVHIPLSSDEVIGYTPLTELPFAEFVEADDAALYPTSLQARDYFNVKREEFAIFFPQDGHAPAITDVPLKKIIVKVAMP